MVRIRKGCVPADRVGGLADPRAPGRSRDANRTPLSAAMNSRLEGPITSPSQSRGADMLRPYISEPLCLLMSPLRRQLRDSIAASWHRAACPLRLPVDRGARQWVGGLRSDPLNLIRLKPAEGVGMTCITQMYFARQGVVTPQMQRVAEREELPVELVRDEVARGRLIIPANVHHLTGRLDPMAIGNVARVKINANIGNSAVESEIDQELEKLHNG